GERMRREKIPERRRLLFDDDRVNRAIDCFAPSATFGSWSAAIIEADDHVSGRGGDASKIDISCLPGVEDGLAGWFAVYVDQNRILFRGIEMRRLHDECVERDSVSHAGLEEFNRRFEQNGSIRP